MKNRAVFNIALLILLGMSTIVSAQVMMRQEVEGAEASYHLKEAQAILLQVRDTLRVSILLPTHLRHEDYADLDFAQDDEVLMFNAERVKTVADFETKYDALAIGETVKLGIRRDGKLRLLSFPKVDPESMPQNARIVVRTESGGAEQTTTTGAYDEGMRPWFGTGVLLKEEDGEVCIGRVLTEIKGVLEQAGIRVGDVLTSFNGEPVATIDALFSAYEDVAVGEEVSLQILRSGHARQIAFIKPEMRMMRREVNAPNRKADAHD